MKELCIIGAIIVIYVIFRLYSRLNETKKQLNSLKNEIDNIQTNNQKDNEHNKNNVEKSEIDIKASSMNLNDKLSFDYIDESTLDDDQKRLYEIMENTNDNLFVTGKAGTGKSYLLNFFRQRTCKRVLFTAPTGIAALNIKGVTLHKAFGFDNLQSGPPFKISNNQKKLLERIDTIVIDEISMVRVDVFDYISMMLSEIMESENPFGGKQVIVFGDLFQLPPIYKDDFAIIKKRYGGHFFFNAKCYSESCFVYEELNRIHRIKKNDVSYMDALNRIRMGTETDKDIEFLNERFFEECPNGVIHLAPTKNKVDQINKNNLGKLITRKYLYHAIIEDGGKFINQNDFLCSFELELKEGALVMMIANDSEYNRWVNGTLGIVSKLTESSVSVFIDGVEYSIGKHTFQTYKCEYDEDEDKIVYKVDQAVTQYPLILAYAITIHKSQGMTYKQAICDVDGSFATGQAYVALSRCSSYDGLYLGNKLSKKDIKVSEECVKFYERQGITMSKE